MDERALVEPGVPPADARALAELAARHGSVDPGAVRVSATSSEALLAEAGDVVAKLHRPLTDREDLTRRLRLARQGRWRECLVAPLLNDPVTVPTAAGPRLATVWPRVAVVPREPEAVPWAHAGATLARLHLGDPPAWLPVHGAPDRLRRGLAALHAVEAVSREHARARAAVEAAAAALPDGAWRSGGAGRPDAVVHGDWHLGQLGQMSATPEGHHDVAGPWRLIDIDDLGRGDPAWDFERPAAMWAAGVLPDVEWAALVAAYREAGGRALPHRDPWPALDAIAQAGVVQAASGAVRRAVLHERALDDVDHLLVEICARIVDGAGRRRDRG